MSEHLDGAGVAAGVTLQLQLDPGLAQGRYASDLLASLGNNECQLTFVAQDLLAVADDSTVGQVVAKIYVANTNLRSMADLLARQADIIDERAKG